MFIMINAEFHTVKMKRTKNCVCQKSGLNLLLTLFFLFCIISSSVSANELHAYEADSLKHILSTNTDPQTRIPVLSRLAKLYDFKPEQITYLKQQYEESLLVDSVPAIYDALENITVSYYNISARDSMLYWGNLVDSVAYSQKEYPNALFYVKNLYCKDLMWKKNYETAMSDVMDFYKLASKTNQKYGMILCSECLGLIYRAVYRDNDAVAAYQECLDLLENYGEQKKIQMQITPAAKLDFQMRITGLQLESCYRARMFEQAEQIAGRYLQYIKQQEMMNEKDGEVYPVKREYWLFYSLCVDMYTRQNKLDKAKEALDNAAKYAGNLPAEGDYVKLVYLFSQAYYYKQSGDLPLALRYINELLSIERIADELQLKADILKEQGKLDEALLLYDELDAFNIKNNDATFMRQINQLRTLHEVNNKEVRNREIAYSNQKMSQKQKQLYLSMMVVFILLILLYILYQYIRRTQQLRNELQHEKDSLLESEKNLIREKEKAEKISRMKSTFVANMSHEIRTPLNAIVGFSSLLTDTSSDLTEKEEYASIIKNNTDVLLNLVNDVLDLSRMETGDLNFKFGYYSLLECSQKALDSVRCRMSDQVKLVFTPDPAPVTLYTDTLRLQQLFTNLLTNAIKFTTEGEIRLSYKLIEEGRKVLIAVTDTGYGIPLEKQATIFKRFEKLDEYKSGAGLGLSICSIIADHLGGSISIDSSYTEGARFVFIHPVVNTD